MDNPDNDIESSFKKLMGVIRLIPIALVAPSWAEDAKRPTVSLRLENRGTETISIEAGQTLAKLEELRLDTEDGDDIISLENLEEEGLSPLQLARMGEDGNILGANDWRTSLSGKRIIERVLTTQLKQVEAWLVGKELDLAEELTDTEKCEFQALAFVFDDAFAWNKKPGLMKGVEFGIDFKEPFVTPFKERVRRCSPAEELAKTKEVKKRKEAGVIRHSKSPWASNVVMVKKKDGT